MKETLIDAPVERFVQLNKYRVHYWEGGAGHPVILLHGGGPGATGMTNYSPNIEPLARHFRVFALDMPGWGDSDTLEEEADHPGRQLADVMVQFLDALGIDKAAFVGNSLGGLTSITTATLYPDRVSHLITMGAPAPFPLTLSPAGPSEGIKVLAAAQRDPSPANMKRLVQAMVYDSSHATDELAEARSRASLDKPEHLARWNEPRSTKNLGSPLPYWALGPQIRDIAVPALIIHGRDDRVVPYENALHLVSNIPDSRMLLLNRCGHWAQIEHAEEFNLAVTAFLTERC
ncbi:alpha/beta hydrolase [Streptomyces sp. Li-HN-5-11]|uniref:alpha/beta fold hydrolase n=1 Tax=Streptomyces sp. Li-HN-5-11 TaxID=3075432 RepID=UPI0028AB9D94|nr:alpha/beta hydrolase [Streptomyces sp. Li-HN-5-11]WNM34751.1 alpha/beta hydrolase [Streptomyces sp. Li-HN-5-11]